jgi:hypothetical protein
MNKLIDYTVSAILWLFVIGVVIFSAHVISSAKAHANQTEPAQACRNQFGHRCK